MSNRNYVTITFKVPKSLQSILIDAIKNKIINFTKQISKKNFILSYILEKKSHSIELTFDYKNGVEKEIKKEIYAHNERREKYGPKKIKLSD